MFSEPLKTWHFSNIQTTFIVLNQVVNQGVIIPCIFYVMLVKLRVSFACQVSSFHFKIGVCVRIHCIQTQAYIQQAQLGSDLAILGSVSSKVTAIIELGLANLPQQDRCLVVRLLLSSEINQYYWLPNLLKKIPKINKMECKKGSNGHDIGKLYLSVIAIRILWLGSTLVIVLKLFYFSTFYVLLSACRENQGVIKN